MTDLKLGLAILGALAVVGVLLYNRWQERSVRRETERAFAAAHPDVLLDDPKGRREPTLESAHRRPPMQQGAQPDARVDYIVELALPAAASGAALLEAWSAIEQRFAKRVLLARSDGASCRAALQLVSRSGVVSDAELLEFRSSVETLAAKLAATVAAPGMREALEAARELDGVCAEADIQVALHVVGIPPGVAVQDPAFRATPRDDGVTLTLDLARTLEPARSYEAMARAGRQLAQSRGGRLVDDHGRELDERALASIGAQLEAVRRILAGRGIEPGSPLALRLFS
jgi:hypothetical protein